MFFLVLVSSVFFFGLIFFLFWLGATHGVPFLFFLFCFVVFWCWCLWFWFWLSHLNPIFYILFFVGFKYHLILLIHC